MLIALLAAGIGAIVVGIAAILYGFMLDLSFGNTLILAGAFGIFSGIIVLAQTLIVQELRNLGRRLGSAPAFTPPRDLASPVDAVPAPVAPTTPWREEPATRDRTRQEAPVAAPPMPPEVAEPAPSRRRNLMFSSTVRKDRERSSPDAAEPAAMPPPLAPAPPPPLPDAADNAHAGFEDAWPRAERPRPSDAVMPRRPARAQPAPPEPRGGIRAGAEIPDRPAPPRADEEPAVTVIKSGIVDGMAYSLYSDGSIEAQMPEGMMRFASIDELRDHLDQRGG